MNTINNIIFFGGHLPEYHRFSFMKTLSIEAGCTGVSIAPPLSLKESIQTNYKPIENIEGLSQITPLLWIPFVAGKLYRSKINNRLMFIQIKKHLKELNIDVRKSLIWVFRPEQYRLAEMFHHSKLIYECYDQHIEAADINEEKRMFINKMEDKLFKKADHVFVTSQELLKVKSHHRPDITLAYNGADYEYFQTGNKNAAPRAITLFNKPVIGYLGTIHRHTDINLIIQIAEKRPDWSLLIISSGPDKSDDNYIDWQKLCLIENVVTTGYIEKTKLPDYCKCFDIGIIPYKIDSTFNKYVNPNKLHEYTAIGVPIVSTKLPNLETHKEIVRIANNPEEFIMQIEKALCEDITESNASKRLVLALKYDWHNRAREMLNVIGGKYILE